MAALISRVERRDQSNVRTFRVVTFVLPPQGAKDVWEDRREGGEGEMGGGGRKREGRREKGWRERGVEEKGKSEMRREQRKGETDRQRTRTRRVVV